MDEISVIANKAKIKIIVADNSLDIKHKFCLGDKSLWGILFFLIGGIFFIVAPFITTSNMTTKMLGILIGFLLLALSILTLLRQVVDRFKITDKEITLRYNLKIKTMPITRELKVKMKIDKLEIRRSGTRGSDFITVTHYFQDLNKEIPIFSFQMNYLDADNAYKLGNRITHIINKKIESNNC